MPDEWDQFSGQRLNSLDVLHDGMEAVADVARNEGGWEGERKQRDKGWRKEKIGYQCSNERGNFKSTRKWRATPNDATKQTDTFNSRNRH